MPVIEYSDNAFEFYDRQIEGHNDARLNSLGKSAQQATNVVVGTRVQGFEALAGAIIARDNGGVINLAKLYGIDLSDQKQIEVALVYTSQERTHRQIYPSQRV